MSQAPGRDDAVWVRTVVGWHVAFWLVVAVCAVAALVHDAPGTDRARTLVALAAVAGAYAWLTRRPGLERVPLRATAYLAVLVLGTTAVIAWGPDIAFFLFIAYPQVWFLTDDLRVGTAWSVVLTVAASGGFLARSGFTGEALADVAPEMAVSLAFSLLLGIWISRIIDQSEQRADLIAALERTRAELGAAQHAAGVVAERERMAAEIHDTLAQGFTSVIALAQAERARLGATGDGAPRLRLLEDTARENLDEARALVAAFAPLDVDGVGLVGALERLAARFTAQTGVPVELELRTTAREVGTRDAVVLLRVAQEALANVRQHAGAGHVRLRLCDEAELTVEVADDGTGFDPGVASADRFGLAGMRHRVEAAGGALAVDSAPGAGTRVTASLP